MRDTLRGLANSEFQNYVEDIGQAKPQYKTLSLVHTTDLARFDTILKKGVLRPVKTDEFYKERLLYLFYGRPSYRVNPHIKNTRVSGFAPVCFIFKPEMPWPAKRVHALDTGAFIHERVDQFMHPDFSVSDYAVESSEKGASNIVNAFYDGPCDYYDCKPSHTLDSEDLAKQRLFRVEAYNELVRHVPNDGTDERVHAIEIQTDKPIRLNGNLLAVVIPARYFDDAQKHEIESKWKCKIVGYTFKSVFSPVDLMSLIYDKVREVLLANDQIP